MGDINRRGDIDVRVVDSVNQYALVVNSDGSINVLTGGVGNAVKHINGTATVTPVAIPFGLTSVSFLIHNTGPRDLFVSFDGGTLFKVVQVNSMLAMDVRITTITLKSSVAPTNYEILVVY